LQFGITDLIVKSRADQREGSLERPYRKFVIIWAPLFKKGNVVNEHTIPGIGPLIPGMSINDSHIIWRK